MMLYYPAIYGAYFYFFLLCDNYDLEYLYGSVFCGRVPRDFCGIVIYDHDLPVVTAMAVTAVAVTDM